MAKETIHLTILMPCLNEAETIEVCINKAKSFLHKQKYSGEILIADNGSTDGSKEIATSQGARVIEVPQKGYGSALMTGIKESLGEYIVMGDADDSYDFSSLEPFIKKLDEGYELVMGNRFKGGIKDGAMPPLHRYLGNPVLSGIGKLFFRSPINDFHSGLRAFKKSSIENLNLQTTGMEYASEMVVKATLFNLKMTEVPIILYPDGRSRKPHLRSWRDGWRHLRFLLLFSPKWLFFLPGFALTSIGFVGLIFLALGDFSLGRFTLSTNTMVFSAMFLILGFNIITLGLYTNIYGIRGNILPKSGIISKFMSSNILEKGIVLGLVLILVGIIGSLLSLYTWYQNDFGQLDPIKTIRLTVPSITSLILGFQTIFTSFFISVLGLQIRSQGSNQ